MARPLLLFDLDGTLLDAAGAGKVALQRAATRLFGNALNFSRILTAGRLDGAIFAEAAAEAGWTDHRDQHLAVMAAYPQELEQTLRERADQVRLLAGVVELFETLDRHRLLESHRSPVLGCLTGNSRGGGEVKLRQVGLSVQRFDLAVFGDEAETREQLVTLALTRYEAFCGHRACVEQVVVIGDTPHDVACAKAHGCRCVAVATGSHNATELRESGADYVLENLIDTEAVMACLLGEGQEG